MLSIFVAFPSFGAEKETLSVIPGQTTIALDQTVAFIAVFPSHPGKSAASRRVIWNAYNSTTRQSGSISPEGVFTARVAGEYQITAKAGETEGHATIRVLPGVAATEDKTPSRVIQVSSRAMSGETGANFQKAPITGRGWRDDIFRMAFQIRNRRGHDPLRRDLENRPLRSVDAGVGDRNFSLTIPIIKIPGRGLDLALTLTYNSNLWFKTTEEEGDPGNQFPIPHMVFDYDQGWPAPGWSLGLGRIALTPSGAAAIQDADGTLHPYEGSIQTSANHDVFQGHTTDGSLIDYTVDSSGNGSVQYPNGTTVAYSASGAHGRYPTQINDANGNFVTITYVNNGGPAIQAIQDTLGRVVNFHYDSSNRLIAVTAPGLNGSTRTVVRFHYSSADLARFCCRIQTDFQDLDAGTGAGKVQQIDGIYFPGSATGYWFGDTDSYSYYGMIAKVSQRRGMTLQASSLNEQGTLSPGTVTRDRVYNYPLKRMWLLRDGPIYTTMTESWASMTVPPAVTHYSVHLDEDPRRIDTVYPDGTQVTQLMYNDPGQFDDSLLFQTITRDVSSTLLRQVSTTWEQGDYSSPRVSAVQISDELGQTVTTQYSYQSPTNSLSEVRQLDYDGTTVLRRTHTEYETDPAYVSRHIFNLPKAISLYGADGRLASLTEYSYDHQPLTNAPFVVGHSDAANPFAEVYDASTDYRGNVTEIGRYIDETGRTIESRRYDITGNLLTRSGSCCEQMSISFSLDTQYAYPSSITRGAPDAASLLRLTESFTYDFDTGLVSTRTDPNKRTTTIGYEDTTLRRKQVIFPALAFVDYSYDDLGMSATQTLFTPNPAVCGLFHNLPCKASVAGKTRSSFNGLGLVRETATLTDGNVFNAVAQEYDVLGRLSQRSQPYQVSQPSTPPPPLLWTLFSHDALGRVISVQNPDGSQATSSYNEPSRPRSASKARGQTVRVVPPYVGDRWYRTDALGQLAEVVEPPAYPSRGGCAPHCPPPPQATKDNSPPMPGSAGSVFMDGSVETSYGYNALGLLVSVLQGPARQERRFRYDLLGRLTAEYLPERSGTLNDAGAYVGPGGVWSDIFTYDERSNLTSRTDARGITARYDYLADPLDRLQALKYIFGAGAKDDGSILPSPPVAYKYMPTGDVTRLFQVSLSHGNDPAWIVQEYGYDTQARVAASKLQHRNQPLLELDYKYDPLDHLAQEIYPAEFGASGQPRKTLDYSYGIGCQLKDFRIDGAEYASQLTYNPAGQATSITVGPVGTQQTLETFAYDPATALLDSQQVQRGSSVLLNMAYRYYPNGQLHQLLEGTGNPEYDYTYDSLGRLWNLKKAAGSDGPEWSESYLFDPYGNRQAVAAAGQVNGATLPPDGLPLLTYDTKTNHVAIPGFTYDAAGNQTRAQRADGSWLRYKYDQSGRLAQVTDDTGKTLESYVYGADGKRLVTTDPHGSTYYFWDRNNVVAEYRQPSSQASWTWSRVRTYLGNRILASFIPGSSGETIYYHHPDRLGTRLITNSTDNSANEQTTLPFGTPLASASAAINPIFTSYDRSSATGLDYAINRHYDPQQRFIQVDPAETESANLRNPQSLSLYTYTINDPVNNVDTVGLRWCDDPLCCECRHGSINPATVTFGMLTGSWTNPSATQFLSEDVQNAQQAIQDWYANGGDFPTWAADFLGWALAPAQVDQAMYAGMAANASPAALDTEIGMIASGNDLYNIIGSVSLLTGIGQFFTAARALKPEMTIAGLTAESAGEMPAGLAIIEGGVGGPAGAVFSSFVTGLAIGYAEEKLFEWSYSGYMPADFVYFGIHGPSAQFQRTIDPWSTVWPLPLLPSFLP